MILYVKEKENDVLLADEGRDLNSACPVTFERARMQPTSPYTFDRDAKVPAQVLVEPEKSLAIGNVILITVSAAADVGSIESCPETVTTLPTRIY
jgi:hypothetical protein